MPPTVSVAAFVFGIILIIAAILGKELKIAAIELPAMSRATRIISGSLGLLLTYIGLFDPVTPHQPDITPTAIVTVSTATIASTVVSTPTLAVIKNVFSLVSANSDNFYRLGNSNFEFGSDKVLRVDGQWNKQVYLDKELPNNFKAIFKFHIEEPKQQFIVGLGDGTNYRPNYHLVMSSEYTAFKTQRSTDIKENWDVSITNSFNERFHFNNNKSYVVVFERKDGKIQVLINGNLLEGINNNLEDIDKYNHLYFASGNPDKPLGTIFIESIEIEEIND